MIQVGKKCNLSSESRKERVGQVCLLWIWHFIPDVSRRKLLQAGTDENISKMRKKEDPSCHSVIFWDLRNSCSVFGTFVLVRIKETRGGCRGFQSTWSSYWFLLLTEADPEFNTSIFALSQIPLHLSFFFFSLHLFIPWLPFWKGFWFIQSGLSIATLPWVNEQKAQQNRWLRA